MSDQKKQQHKIYSHRLKVPLLKRSKRFLECFSFLFPFVYRICVRCILEMFFFLYLQFISKRRMNKIQTNKLTGKQRNKETDRRTNRQADSERTIKPINVQSWLYNNKRLFCKDSFMQISRSWWICGSGHVFQSCPHAEPHSQRVSSCNQTIWNRWSL